MFKDPMDNPSGWQIFVDNEFRKRFKIPQSIKYISLETFIELSKKPKEFKQNTISINNLLKDGTKV